MLFLNILLFAYKVDRVKFLMYFKFPVVLLMLLTPLRPSKAVFKLKIMKLPFRL